jgi:YD repeat-containing protein
LKEGDPIARVAGNFQYTYDDAGNQIARTDGNNNTTQFQYDARKRLIKTAYPDGTSVTNSYDGPGNLASVTDQASNVVQYSYDGWRSILGGLAFGAETGRAKRRAVDRFPCYDKR